MVSCVSAAAVVAGVAEGMGSPECGEWIGSAGVRGWRSRFEARFTFEAFGAVLDAAQLVIPEALVVLDPLVNRPEVVAVEAVHAASAFAYDADEAGLAEDPEVFGNLRLGPAEGFDKPGDVALGTGEGEVVSCANVRSGVIEVASVALGEQVEEFPTPRLGDGGEGVGNGLDTGHAVIYA